MTEIPPPQTLPSGARSGWGCARLSGVALIVGLLGVGAMTWLLVGGLRKGWQWMQGLPGRLIHQEITHQFRQSITEIISTRGEVLEVATMQTDETITKFDMKTALDQWVYLGTTVSEIRTPVVYRYHIRLSEPWQMEVVQGVCHVKAPALRASLPPAIRTEGMEKKSEAGWLRFNAAENLAALEKELTPTLERRAGNQAHLNLVRESARTSVAAFVKTWLLKHREAGQGEGIQAIAVTFADEPKTTRPSVTLTIP